MKQYEKDEYQAYLNREKATIAAIKKSYEDALEQVDEKIRVLSTRTDIENMPTIIHQQKYQMQLKEQLEGILEKLQEKQYKTVNDYLNDCYSESFLRTMYSLNQQGIPFVWPIDQKAVERAVVLDSKISGGLYTNLGVDVQSFKKNISSEISRGIASSLSYSEIARNLKNASRVPISNASRIVRTEGHRIQNQAKLDTMNEAKKKGADVVKQWDATLDGKTRDTHRKLDGQIREIDEDFEVDGMHASAPGMFGDPSEDCNCRCAVLQRAKWALDESELETLKERAEYFGLDKTDDFNDFKEKYLNAANNVAEGADSGSVRSDVQKISDPEKTKEAEYLIRNHIGVENATQERIVANDAIAHSSEKVQNAIQNGTIVDVGKSGASQYDYENDIIYIAKNATKEEADHEIGHMVENKLLDPQKVKEVKLEMIGKPNFLDIKKETYYDAGGNPNEIFILVNENLISEYQGRIYADTIYDMFDEDGRFRDELMLEFISEPYREYMNNPEILKSKNQKLYDFIQGAVE